MSAITVNCFKQGGKRDELGHDLDEFISNDFIFGINMGFWAAMTAVVLIVIVMNAVFWGMKPKH